jgi:MoxR-like ATPase
MLKVVVGYPTPEEELTVVERSLAGLASVRRALELDELTALRSAAEGVFVDPALSRYAIRLATATREPDDSLKPYIAFGASPRGPIALVTAARALALIRGREYALPQDLRDLAKDAFRHRIVLTYEALASDVDVDTILDRVLGDVPAPEIELADVA